MIAVVGATGYIGGLLSRRLAEGGEEVVALARHPERAGDLEAAGCEVRQADVLEPDSLGPALEGVDVAYYLVHSMGRGGEGDYAMKDTEGARNFAAAMSQAPGLSGTPDSGQRSSAATRASCASSSARPTSRTTRAIPAMSRADSILQTASKKKP